VAGAPADESPPPLPGEAEEAAFLAGSGGTDEPVFPAETAAVQPEPSDELPPLDDLVRRIPPGVRAALDEMFRARFTGVKRVTEADLK
jgi:hypothetical protein